MPLYWWCIDLKYYFLFLHCLSYICCAFFSSFYSKRWKRTRRGRKLKRRSGRPSWLEKKQRRRKRRNWKEASFLTSTQVMIAESFVFTCVWLKQTHTIHISQFVFLSHSSWGQSESTLLRNMFVCQCVSVDDEAFHIYRPELIWCCWLLLKQRTMKLQIKWRHGGGYNNGLTLFHASKVLGDFLSWHKCGLKEQLKCLYQQLQISSLLFDAINALSVLSHVIQPTTLIPACTELALKSCLADTHLCTETFPPLSGCDLLLVHSSSFWLHLGSPETLLFQGQTFYSLSAFHLVTDSVLLCSCAKKNFVG